MISNEEYAEWVKKVGRDNAREVQEQLDAEDEERTRRSVSDWHNAT